MRRGTTLLELLVVITILGILTSIAVPAYRGITRWSNRTAARELTVRIREVRHAAITSGQNCTITFYDFSRQYRVDLPGERLWVQLPEGVSFAANNFPLTSNRPTLYFRYTGAPNRGGHVVLRDTSGNFLYVIVTPVTGRVRLDTKPP